MFLTSSPKAALPRHSTGWGVMRLISDRAGKNAVEQPAQWGKHRHVTSAEAFAILERRVNAVRAVMRLRETRP